MDISIIGLGWFGECLASKLLEEGYQIYGTTRSQEKQTSFTQSGIRCSLLDFPQLPSSELFESSIIVLNIPPFPDQLKWFQSWPWSQVHWPIFISSTSQKEILLKEEEWIQNHFSTWTILRFAGLIGGERHPGKILSGKTNLPGRLWPVNLIHRDDAVSFTKMVIEKKIQNKVINVVSDSHPTREDYYTNYCLRNNLTPPHFDAKDLSTKEAVSSREMAKYFKTSKI